MARLASSWVHSTRNFMQSPDAPHLSNEQMDAVSGRLYHNNIFAYGYNHMNDGLDIIVSFEILTGGMVLVGNEADFFATRKFLATLGLTDTLSGSNGVSRAMPGNVVISHVGRESHSSPKMIAQNICSQLESFWVLRNVSGVYFVHVSNASGACSGAGKV